MTWIYFVLVPLSLLPLTIVLYKMNKHKKMKQSGVRSTATVLKLLGYSTKGLNQVLIQYPVVDTGQVITLQITVAGTPYSPGQSLPVLYDRNDPYKMVLDSGSFLFMIIFTLIIAIGIIAAAYMINKSVAEGHM